MREVYHAFVIVPWDNPHSTFGSFQTWQRAVQWQEAIETRRQIRCRIIYSTEVQIRLRGRNQ